MANLFTEIDADTCVLSIEDVQDSYNVPFGDSQQPLISDETILSLIIKAQNKINSYLKSIRSEITCENLCGECVPIDIKRATLMSLKEDYDYEIAKQNQANYSSGIVFAGIEIDKLPSGISLKEASCDTDISIQKTKDIGDGNPCNDISCDITNMLECYRVNSMKFKLCGDDSCCITSCRCKPCCDDTCNDCK